MGEFGAVHGVEMKMLDTREHQHAALLGRDHGGDGMAQLGVFVEPIEQMAEPLGHVGATHAGEFFELRHIGDGQDARCNLGRDAARAAALDETQIHIHIKEELGDGAGGAGIELALQVVDIIVRRAGLGVGLGVGGDADIKIRDFHEARDQFIGIGVAIFHVGARGIGRHIAAQGHNIAHASGPVFTGDGVNLGAAGIDAGEMRRRGEIRLAPDAGDGGMGALTRGAACAIRHRDKAWPQWCQRTDDLP